MRSALGRWSAAKVVRTLVAGTAILGVAHTASARDDAGVHDFFSSMFGGGEQSGSAPAAAQHYQQTPFVDPLEGLGRSATSSRAERPLTVKLHRPKVAKLTRLVQLPARSGRVSIFEDRTLRRGDAVMTAKGIRIFAGSRSWPYQETDFVALADARQLSKDLQKVLLDLDRMPHG